MPTLSAEQLERVFPFYLSFDAELRLTALGGSLKKLIAEPKRSQPLTELFELERPLLPSVHLEALVGRGRSLVVLALRDRGLRLRGEVLPTAEGGLFIGSPWVQELSALTSAGLTLRDFASHDQTGDLLVMLRSMQTSVQEAAQASERLRQEATQREAVLKELQAKLLVIEQQREMVQALSAPVIQLWDRVLAVPIIGEVDAERSAHLMQQLLEAVIQQRAHYAILDVTGVRTMSEEAVQHFVRLLRAVELIGARGLISGVGAALARSLTQRSQDVGSLRSFGSLRAALAYCLAQSPA